MIVTLFLLAQFDFSGTPRRVTTSPDGHIVLTTVGFSHIGLDGGVIYEHQDDRQVMAAKKIDKGYLLLWLASTGPGVDLLDPAGRLSWSSPGQASKNFIDIKGVLYVTPRFWAHQKTTVLSPVRITDTGAPLMNTKKIAWKPKVLDRNHELLWTEDRGKDTLLVTQLDSTIYVLRDQKKAASVKLHLNMRPFKEFSGGLVEWLKSFDRIVMFGAIDEGYALAIEREGYTTLVTLDRHLSVLRTVDLDLWRNDPEALTGTDGYNVHKFNYKTHEFSLVTE